MDDTTYIMPRIAIKPYRDSLTDWHCEEASKLSARGVRKPIIEEIIVSAQELQLCAPTGIIMKISTHEASSFNAPYCLSQQRSGLSL